MTERTDFIATLQACYFGDKNAFEKVLRIYDEKQDRIDKAIEYMKPRFMNCIDNEKRYFEDYDIQQIYEILKGDNNEC